MASKLVTGLIILTVAALCAAAAFQYLEMEAFGLPAVLKERFFPAPPPAAEPAANENADAANGAATAPAEGANAEAPAANPAEAPANP